MVRSILHGRSHSLESDCSPGSRGIEKWLVKITQVAAKPDKFLYGTLVTVITYVTSLYFLFLYLYCIFVKRAL